jgi:hypothetical protein
MSSDTQLSNKGGDPFPLVYKRVNASSKFLRAKLFPTETTGWRLGRLLPPIRLSDTHIDASPCEDGQVTVSSSSDMVEQRKEGDAP